MIRSTTFAQTAGIILTGILGSSVASAQQVAETTTPEASQEIMVPLGTAAGTSGRLAVNIAAGDNNQQTGDAIVAIGDYVSLTQSVTQRMSGPAPANQITSITIGDGAFSGTRGLSSINITAGTQNQMANLALLAVGNSGALSDQLLEQSRAPTEPKGGILETALPANDRIAIGDAAFGDGSGLIQVNLIGGEGNTSANTFALSIVGEGSP